MRFNPIFVFVKDEDVEKFKKKYIDTSLNNNEKMKQELSNK